MKKSEKFSFNSFRILYVLSLLFPSTNIINLLGIFLNLFSAFINNSLLPASFLAGIAIEIKCLKYFHYIYKKIFLVHRPNVLLWKLSKIFFKNCGISVVGKGVFAFHLIDL